MKVKLKPGWSRTYPALTIGNVYRVLGIEADGLRIICDAGEPILFDARAFEFVDSKLPSNWVSAQGDDGEQYAYPPEISDPPYFFEKYFDDEMAVRQKFHRYVFQLCYEESAAAPAPPNSYIRAEWKHENPDDPIALYSEIDADRWEVRKVEVFRDGRVTYAWANGSTGTTELGAQPLPSLAEIAGHPEFDVSEIGSSKFEAVWAEALESDATTSGPD